VTNIPVVCQDKATIALWPDAGNLLGLSKNATYLSAKRGDFPGVFRVGGTYRVAVAPLLRRLGLDEQGPDGDPPGREVA
jgi:hypothetical protein